jgi:UDP-N-acetylmuramate dehydrogenase
MSFIENHSLKSHNTFAVDCSARLFAVFSTVDQLQRLLPNSEGPLLVLGGGSNILLTKDFPGTVLKNKITGIEVVSETKNHTIVRVGGGEVWHDFVLWSIANNLGGIENLSLIPGSVGAAPMQNIGAYGIEIESVFEQLEAVSVDTLETKTFNKEDCHFSYRNSIFKGELRGEFIITRVYFCLNKTSRFNTSYGAIEKELENMGCDTLTLENISNAVINIRQRRLPDPKVLGNSGSFFKNPVISLSQFTDLQSQYPHIVGYPVSETEIKVPAGWLIDQAGWKGYRKGDAGIHKNHALVLVNHGSATGSELVQLSKEIQHSVQKKFGIMLENEVNII